MNETIYNREVTKAEEVKLRNIIKAMSKEEQEIVIEELPTVLLIDEIKKRNHILEQTIKQMRSHLERPAF